MKAYQGLSQTGPETTSLEYLGMGNPLPYRPQAGRADRLDANIVGGSTSSLSEGSRTASGTSVL